MFFLKDGSRLELAGLERYDEVRQALWRGGVVGGWAAKRASIAGIQLAPLQCH